MDQLLILDEEVEINGITKHEAIKSAVAHYDNEADVYIRDIEFTENKYKIVLDSLLGESNPASIEVNATTGEITKERTDQNG